MHRTFSQPGMWRKQDEDKSGWLTERQLAEGVKLVYCVARVLGLSVFQSANRKLNLFVFVFPCTESGC